MERDKCSLCYFIIVIILYYWWEINLGLLWSPLPSRGVFAVVNLGFDAPFVVMVASQDVPGHLEGWLSVHILKGVLAGEENKQNNSSGLHSSQKREVTKQNTSSLYQSTFSQASVLFVNFVNKSVIPSLYI